MRVELVSSSAEETEAIAARLAARLERGDVVTVGHRYGGRVDVSHLDLYRFAGVSAAEWGDLEPYFDDAIVFVEWPEAGIGTLPTARIAVELAHVDPTTRRFRLDAAEGALLEGLAGADSGLRHGD